MKSFGAYIFRVFSAGLAAIVTFQTALIFPSQEAGKYFSFMGVTYVLSTFIKMGQSYRYLSHKALDLDELLNPLLFFKESFLLITLNASVVYMILKTTTLLLPWKLDLPAGYIEFLCLSAYLMAIVYNNAEYQKVIGDSFGYIFYSNFLIGVFNLCIFSLLYVMVKNLTALHAILGFILSLLAGSLVISFRISLWKTDITAKKIDKKDIIPLLNTNIRAGFIFMLYELSEHLQAWSVPFILTILNEYSIIVEYRLAFRMLSLISFVPLIVNSNFSMTFGTLINSQQRKELNKLLPVVIKKTALGAGIALLIIYSTYPLVQYLVLSDKYSNLFNILMILTFGFVICAVLDSSTVILNLMGDKRMLPFFLNLFVFLLVFGSGLFYKFNSNSLIIFTSFSMAMSAKGFLQYYLLRKKLT